MGSEDHMDTSHNVKEDKVIENETESVENKEDDGMKNQGQSQLSEDLKDTDDLKDLEQKEDPKVEKMEINEQPMGQQYVGVTSSVRQTFDTKQASALFDLAMK